MQDLPRSNPDDLHAILRDANALRVAMIRDAALRVGQWFSRSLQRVTHAH